MLKSLPSPTGVPTYIIEYYSDQYFTTKELASYRLLIQVAKLHAEFKFAEANLICDRMLSMGLIKNPWREFRTAKEQTCNIIVEGDRVVYLPLMPVRWDYYAKTASFSVIEPISI